MEGCGCLILIVILWGIYALVSDALDFLKDHAAGLTVAFAVLMGGWKLLKTLSEAESTPKPSENSPLPEGKFQKEGTPISCAKSMKIAAEPLQLAAATPAKGKRKAPVKLSKNNVTAAVPQAAPRETVAVTTISAKAGPLSQKFRAGVTEVGRGLVTELTSSLDVPLTLAIDFGSSRTKVAYFCTDAGKPKIIELGQEIRAIIPSVFYIPQNGRVLIGDDAVQMADEDPAGIVTDIKRELHRPSKIRCGEGRPAYQRWELVSFLFSEIRRRCSEEVFHSSPSNDCILTVPVCFSEPQRQKLREAAEHAGFTNVRLLEEPVAAAMHWLSSSGKSVSDHVIVVDIGGGTTDLAALKLEGSTYEPIPDLPSSGFASGGNDIDEDVRRAVQKEFPSREEDSGAWLLKLRQVKERLIKMDREAFSINLTGRTQSIQRTVVESAVRALVEKTRNEFARFLKDFEEITGRRETPVLLAGGGSKLPGMREALQEVAGRNQVIIWNEGEYAIALGGAYVRNDPPFPLC